MEILNPDINKNKNKVLQKQSTKTPQLQLKPNGVCTSLNEQRIDDLSLFIFNYFSPLKKIGSQITGACHFSFFFLKAAFKKMRQELICLIETHTLISRGAQGWQAFTFKRLL